MHKSSGLVSFTKRMFWPCFKAAWDESFTKKNIKFVWVKIGIWPTIPLVVISVIAPPRPLTPPGAS
jgi:hypothetical protein